MNLIGNIHARYAYGRRVERLSKALAELIPRGARVLDVGCGDGLVAHLIRRHRSDIEIQGIDVLVRPQLHIPVAEFDGRVIPYDDASFDAVMFVDVLHHTEDPMVLLREAVRTARQAVVIKDHTSDGLLADPTLRLMDYVGNAHHGVVLPYNYWPRQQWLAALDKLGLSVGAWEKDLRLYARPASWVFDRDLHFVARLDKPPLAASAQAVC